MCAREPLLTLAAGVLPLLAQQAPSASLTIHADRPGPQVNRQLFGQFAEHLGAGIYGGIWVGRRLQDSEHAGIPQRRSAGSPRPEGPGGPLARRLFRRRVQLAGRRRTTIQAAGQNQHALGGVTEPNTFGTHQFMDFAEMIGAEAYISGNVQGRRHRASWRSGWST